VAKRGRETALFETRSTTWSTLRVETPATYASCTTKTSASLAVVRALAPGSSTSRA
jgi:hypothetical protein